MKNINYYLTALLLIAILCVMLGGCDLNKHDEQAPLVFTDSEFHPGNSKQHNSKVQLGVGDGKLYKWSTDDHKLYCYMDGKFSEIYKVDCLYATIHDGYFYYGTLANKLCSYNLESGVYEELGDLGFYHMADRYALDEVTMAIPTDKERASYYRLTDGGIAEEISTHEAYTFGEYTYMLTGPENLKVLARYDQEGNCAEYDDELYKVDMVMFPCTNGLVVTTGSDGKQLYYIDGTTGEIIGLFSVDCLGTSTTLNVHKDTVYMSVLCYVEMSSLTWKSEPSDDRNGTYRISLSDYSVEKISDEVYNGLFIFDDSGIYACNDDGDVYKLDFNGNVLTTLRD